MIWELPEVSKEEVEKYVQRYGCDPLTAAILIRRGIKEPQDIRFFLDDDIRSVHNPFLFADMGDAVERILMAKSEGEKVLVFGDRDVDGITSTALLTSRLEELGIDTLWQIPMGDEHYGLTIEAIQNFASQDGTLIITVDCGITSVQEVDFATSLGIDTIIIDHHNPQDTIPEAVAIINPKLDDSGYPFDGLCGAALVSKVLWALRFAGTNMFKQRFTLLNVRPGNESIIFEAVKLENLVEVDRLVETIVPGLIRPEDTRLVSFLANEEILVYGEKAQVRLMKQVFGPQAEIGVTDISSEIAKVFPSLQGVSLLRMLQGSKLAKFSPKTPLEIEALKQLVISYLLHKNPQLTDEYLQDLDLVAMGLVADMMPMRDENRSLVRAGLASLEKTRRQGLRQLLHVAKLAGKPISSTDLGWKLGPIINSTGRMGKPDQAVQLLLAKEQPETQVGELVKSVVAMNDSRKELGAQAWSKIYPLAKQSKAEFKNRFLLVRDDSVHRGITGILAGRLSREFNVPSVVVAFVEGRAVGSIRTVRGFSATRFMSYFEDVFENWGGHDAAGGFSLPAQKFDEFHQRITKILDYLPLDEEAEEKLVVDLKVPHDRMNPGLEDLDKLFHPHGQEFPRITYQVNDAVIDDVQFLGKTQEHIKLTLSVGKTKWPALMWGGAPRVGVDIAKSGKIDAVFHLDKNFWGTNQTLQLQLLDVKQNKG